MAAVVVAGARAALVHPPVMLPPPCQRQGTSGLRTVVLPHGALLLPGGVHGCRGQGASLNLLIGPTWREKWTPNIRAVWMLHIRSIPVPTNVSGVGRVLGRSPVPHGAPNRRGRRAGKWRAARALPSWTRLSPPRVLHRALRAPPSPPHFVRIPPNTCAPPPPLTTAVVGGFGGRGAWPVLHGPSSHYVGPHGCSNTRVVTK